MTRFLLAAVALVAAAGPAQAQKIAPGLWEHTITMKMTGNPQAEEGMKRMQEQLERMPPEQRKQMEAMMGRQGGTANLSTGLAMLGGKPVTTKVCITPEQAARDYTPSPQEHCQQMSTERSGKTMKVKFSCTRPGGGTTSGEGTFTLVSDKEHSGRFVMDGTGPQGQPMHIEGDQSGRWLGADCGDVKPRVAPTPPVKK